MRLALVLGSFLWTAALFAAPAVAGSHSALSRAAVVVYSAGAVVCHQRPERSFAIGGRPLPVCARCTGLYVSSLIGGLLALVAGRPLERSRARGILAAAAIPTAVTWIGEVAGLVHPSNATRAIAAIPLGAAAAWLVVSTIGSRRQARRRGAHAV